jgi:hypothetical protein
MYDVVKMTKAHKEGLVPMFPLPINLFPQPLQEMIEACAKTYCIPPDYWAGAVLAATALGIGTRLQLVNNYRNYPVIWMVLVGDVSTGKTMPMDFCLNFFKKLDNQSIKKYEEEMADYNRQMGLSAKDRLMEGSGENPVKPGCLQYILNDFTPEALVEAHSVNNRGLMILRDELKGWIDDFGRYNKSGEQSNMLSSWSGVAMSYNRKGSGVMNINEPFILVCGGMQPDLLPTLAADSRTENGFLSRFCCVYPDNAMKAGYNSELLPDKYRLFWEDYLTKLVGMTGKIELTLSKEAEEKYAKWYDINANVINAEPSGYLRGVYGKLDIICLRAGVLARGMNMICNGDFSTEITERDMRCAISLTEYFRATALKVYRKIFVTVQPKVKKRDIASYLHRNTDLTDTSISRLLQTSRSQIRRSCEKTEIND